MDYIYGMLLFFVIYLFGEEIYLYISWKAIKIKMKRLIHHEQFFGLGFESQQRLIRLNDLLYKTPSKEQKDIYFREKANAEYHAIVAELFKETGEIDCET